MTAVSGSKCHLLAAAASTVLSPIAITGRAFAFEEGQSLPIPDVIECGTDTEVLEARASSHKFYHGIDTRTWGFSQSYLGPVLRVKRGQTTNISIKNKLSYPVTCHWHGLHVEGDVDGGPHSPIAPEKTWSPALNIDQPAGTLWYHSHVHGVTAEQVYYGLAGMMIIDDPDAPPSGLPDTYGVDDIPLIIQDKAFDEQGRLAYIKRGPFLMHGFRAGEMVVNGVIKPTATVPKSLVRLRLLNASNARIYHFCFDDNRVFHQVASDGGLLPKPHAISTLSLAPAERVEIVVDFSNGKKTKLLSAEDTNTPMRHRSPGGGGMFSPVLEQDGKYIVMSFDVNNTSPAPVKVLSDLIAGAPEAPDWGEPVVERRFQLQMHVGGRGMGGMRHGDITQIMGINGKSMDMHRIDTQTKLNETELWTIESLEMAHPFHVHGTQFQVKSLNNRPVDFDTTGFKDVILVDGKAELLVRFPRKADQSNPYMYHCHILEHEDAGMMGQLTVT